MKRPLAGRDFPAGYQANKEGDREPGTRFSKRDPAFLVLATISFVLIGTMTALLIADIHELRSGTPLETPRPLSAFTTASLSRTDPQSVQIAAPVLGPALASKPEIDRTARPPESGQNTVGSPGEHLSGTESQFDRPRQRARRRKGWLKSSNVWAKRDGAIDAKVAFLARKTKPAGDGSTRQFWILKRYLERQKGDARDFPPHQTTDARQQPHKKQILDSALRNIGRVLGF